MRIKRAHDSFFISFPERFFHEAGSVDTAVTPEPLSGHVYNLSNHQRLSTKAPREGTARGRTLLEVWVVPPTPHQRG